MDAIDDCKCASPTPTVAFADCYTQDTLYSFDGSDGWAYCQRPGYFMSGLKTDSASMSDLNAIKCCKPTYQWLSLQC